MKSNGSIGIGIALLLGASSAQAADNLLQPVLRLPPMAHAPVIDGHIDETEWAGAWVMEGSVGSGDQNLDERKAWAYIGYDDEHLYMAIRSATRPGGRLHMWEKDPDEAILNMDGVEFWAAALHNPDQPPIDRYQIWFDPFGTQWALVHRYGAGFNVQEELNRASAIHGDEWHIELALPWRLLNLTAEDLGKGQHLFLRPCRNWVGPFIYTSWGGRGAFYSMDNTLRVILDPDAPLVRIPSLGELFDGRADVRVEVVNQTGEPVEIAANLEIGAYPNPGAAARLLAPGEPVATEVGTLSVSSGQKSSLTLSADFEPVGILPDAQQNAQVRESYYSVRLNVTRTSDNAVLFTRFFKVPGRRTAVWRPLPTRDLTLRGGYYPYHGKVLASVDLGEDPRRESITRAVVTVRSADDEGSQPFGAGEIVDFPYGVGQGIVETGDLPAGRYVIRTELYAGDDKLELEPPLQRAFTREIMPWEGTGVGITDKVYPPFTAIAVDGQTLSTVLRDHEMNGLGLWNQVVAKGEPMMAGPMRLELRAHGKTLDWTLPDTPRVTKQADHEVRIEGEAASSVLAVKTRCLWEYDGMMKVELDLEPVGDVSVDGLDLVIPLKASVATLLHSTTATRSNPSFAIPDGEGVVWDSRSMVQTIGKGSFTPYIWIGGEERGISWFADNDQGWITDDREPAVTIERSGDVVTMRIRFINRPGAIPGPRHIVFGLMATPVKPIPAESRAWWPDRSSPRSFIDHLPSWRFAGFSDRETLDPLGGDFSIFEYFAEHQGTRKMPPDAEAVLRNWMLQYRENPDRGGLFGDLRSGFNRTVNTDEIVFYTNPALEAGNSPQGRQFIHEWKGGIRSMGINYGDSYNDYAAWCYDQMLAPGLRVGVYQDNTFPVASLDLIAGTAYIRDDGRVQAGWKMFAHRDFYKRLFVTGWERMGRMPLIYPHTTNAKAAPLFSFATIHLALEWEQRSLRTFQEKFSFDLLRTEVMGKQTGLIPRILCSMGDPPPAGATPEQRVANQQFNAYLYRTREGVLMLHDSYGRGLGPYFGHVVKALMPYGFHLESCEYIGYWKNPAGVTVPEGTQVSLFKTDGGVLAVVVDVSGQEGIRRVAFDAETLGRPVETIRDVEADAFEAPGFPARLAIHAHPDRDFQNVAPGRVEFNLRRHDYILLLVE